MMDEFESLVDALKDNATGIVIILAIVTVVAIIGRGYLKSAITLKAIESYKQDQLQQEEQK
jgi:hypothetical protein